jgi:hypothetical protein
VKKFLSNSVRHLDHCEADCMGGILICRPFGRVFDEAGFWAQKKVENQ